MATAYIDLSIGSAVPPDGTSSNLGPALARVQGTEANPKKHALVADFDATNTELLWWSFRMPVTPSAIDAKIQWTSTSTTSGHQCRWEMGLGAVTPADADTPIEHAGAAVSGVSSDVNTTEAGRLIEASLSLANLDSVAAGDRVFVLLQRNGGHADDDMTGDARCYGVMLEVTYT